MEPVRCFTCGKVLRFYKYKKLQGSDKDEFLKKLKICCVRMYLTSIDVIFD